jgi:hypothetical protein
MDDTEFIHQINFTDYRVFELLLYMTQVSIQKHPPPTGSSKWNMKFHMETYT